MPAQSRPGGRSQLPAGPMRSRADCVLHVASPVPTVNWKSDDNSTDPCDGTARSATRGREAGVADVLGISATPCSVGRVREKPFTEADWTDETNRADTSPMTGQRSTAERARRGHGTRLRAGGSNLSPSVPALVLGPVLGSDFSASIEAVRKLLDGSDPGLYRMTASTWSTYATSRHCKSLA